MLWIKEVEMVDSVDELKSSRSIAGKEFPEFWSGGRENCFCFEQDHPEFPLQKEGQSGGTESPERWSFSSRKADRLHDLGLLLSHWCSWCRSWWCGFILHHSSPQQCSGLRYEMGWNFVYDQDPIGWCSGEFVQIENTWVWSTQNCIRIVRHGDSSGGIDAQLSEVEDDGEEEHRSETSTTKFRRQKRKIETGAVVACRRR